MEKKRFRAISNFYKNRSLQQLHWLAFLLAVPAFLVNLNQVGFIGDEAIRTLVAFEMKVTGNYLVPTLNGELYYNKPPLYNWFILGLSNLFGYFGEWPTRLTTIICLTAFGCSVYYYTKKQFDSTVALIVTLMTLTCGRILFWDSMLGLIDICFSWIIYLNFMTLYHFGKKEKWTSFFISSYLLCSIAFLLKGIPAVVFQGLSILTALYFFQQMKSKFFSWQHITGILIGLSPLALYYSLYAYKVSLPVVFSILLEQSMQRTGTHFGWWKTLVHIFTFPFEQIYHFLPWSVLILPVFHPKFLSWIKQHPFIKYNFWMLLVNLPVYWISVEVYPRYLLMFVPLFNIIVYYLYEQIKEHTDLYQKRLHQLFSGVLVLAIGFLLFSPLDERLKMTAANWGLWAGSIVLMVSVSLGLLIDQRRLLLWLGIVLLSLRVVFSILILPIREQTFAENRTRNSCKELTQKHKGHTWYVFDSTETFQVARFYTSVYANQQIKRVKTATDTAGIYIVNPVLYPAFPGKTMDTLLLETGQKLVLMKLN
jgi:4-amino-4-deoxy-L-arabinose transferase-like glycosyltransferase